ncbi:MAG: hypothetical protein QXU92_01245 [Candidatus Diapherotrites archaeon]
MFHIGKVLQVMSSEEKGSKFSDQTTQALVEMWDENLIIFKVNQNISRELKENDYVLVDYSPVAVGGAPVPKHEITAIVSEQKAKKVWSKLKEKFEQKKNEKKKPDFDFPALQGKMVG